MDSKQAKAEANKLKAEEIRQKAMESFGQTKAREGQEEPAKKERRELKESLPGKVMDSKQVKAEANKLKAEEIRQKAMESFGQTKAREGQEEPAKKERRGGNDSIQFLREKSEMI